MRNRPHQEINRIISEVVTEPATAFKLAIGSNLILGQDRQAPQAVQADIFAEHWGFFHFLGDCYHQDKEFVGNSIFLDATIHPRDHLYAFYTLAKVMESTRYMPDRRVKGNLFQCMPLCNTWIPQYVMIDTTIMRELLLHEPAGEQRNNPLRSVYEKQIVWNHSFRVLNDRALLGQDGQLGNVDTEARDNPIGAFKDQQGSQRFFGPTNEIQVERGTVSFRGTMYTDGLGVSVVKANENTTANNERNQGLRDASDDPDAYVQNQQFRDTAAFHQRNIVYFDPGRRDILYGMHHDSQPHQQRLLRFTLGQRNRVYKTKKYSQIRARVRQPAANVAEQNLSFSPNKATVNPSLFAVVCHIRGQVDQVMEHFYTNSTTVNGNALHRKLKLSANINRRKYYQSMDKKIKQLGGNRNQRPHLIIGNYSAPNVRYHQPIPGKGLRKQLRSFQYNVTLIDEYLTSQICPFCQHRNNRLENFRVCQNPRPAVPTRRTYQPLTIRWGLLRCSNDACNVNGNRRILNRDMAGVLNFRGITINYEENGELLPAFRRRQRQA